ncbi:TRAP transporter small permease subunit [Rhizobium sp. AN80A]|uniref:TRAP transporter small permease n=1 Tax=Rhizobium sp. AN80A TaxID=3040673 RepID=UPI0024B3BAED|nr:TRAP transporter small permease subunit [Rhizobium sp. AN80A]
MARALELLGVVSFVVMFFSTLLGVIARYFEFGGVEWSFEVAGIAFIWITFIGLLNAELRGENVAFEALNHAAPAGLKRVLDLISVLALVTMGAAFLISGLAVWQRSAMVPTAVLRMPTGVITATVLVLGIGALVIGARRLLALTVFAKRQKEVRT